MKRSIWLLSLGFLLVFLGAHSVENHVFALFGGDEDFAYKVLILAFVGLVVGNIVAPAIISRFGPRRVLFVAGLAFAGWTALMARGDRSLALWISPIFGLFVAQMWNGSILYVLTSVPEEEAQGKAFGLNHGLYAVGIAIGLIAFGVMLGAGFSFGEILYPMAALAAIGSFLFLRMKDIPVNAGVKITEVFRVLRNPNALRLSAVCMLLFFLYGVLDSQVIVDVKKVAGAEWIGPVECLMYGTLAGSIFLGGKIAVSKRTAILVAIALTITGLAVLFYAQTLVALAIGVVLIGAAHAILWVVMSMLATFAPANRIEAATAVFNLVDDLTIVGTLVLAKMMQDKSLYLIGVAVALMAVAVLWPFLRASSFDNEARERLRILE